MKFIVGFLCLSLSLFSCNSAKKVGETPAKPVGVEFVNSEKLSPLLEMANDKDKIVFVDFYATWCLPCKMMDEDVFTDKNISQYFNKNFINYKVDGEKGNGANLALLYQITVYPTLLFLDGDGKVLVRKEGAAYHTELRALAEEALSAHANNNTGD
jgi:thiol:disulfide interchange protein